MKNFFVNTKYCLISNSNVNSVVTDMNNIESSLDFDRSNQGCNINNI